MNGLEKFQKFFQNEFTFNLLDVHNGRQHAGRADIFRCNVALLGENNERAYVKVKFLLLTSLTRHQNGLVTKIDLSLTLN